MSFTIDQAIAGFVVLQAVYIIPLVSIERRLMKMCTQIEILLAVCPEFPGGKGRNHED